jgi:hypothetical protein
LGEAGVAEHHHRITEPAQVRPRHGHVHVRWLVNRVGVLTASSPARVCGVARALVTGSCSEGSDRRNPAQVSRCDVVCVPSFRGSSAVWALAGVSWGMILDCAAPGSWMRAGPARLERQPGHWKTCVVLGQVAERRCANPTRGLAAQGVFKPCGLKMIGVPATKKARADGVVGFLSRQRATRHRELRGTGVEEAAPGQPKSLGTDAFTASLPKEPRWPERKLGDVGEAWR